MLPFKWELYERLVENSRDTRILEYIQAERDVLIDVPDRKHTTIIDAGAGYGRMFPTYAALGFADIIGIEMNPDMLEELLRRSAQIPNSRVIVGDMKNLQELLADIPVQNPVITLLQNTLGTLEGDELEIMTSIRDFAFQNRGSVLWSVFRAKALSSFGVEFYSDISEMAGELDVANSLLDEGLFVSKNGYSSKWRTDAEIKGITAFLGGGPITTAGNHRYHISHQRTNPEFIKFLEANYS